MRLLSLLRRARSRPWRFLAWKAGRKLLDRVRACAFDRGRNVYRLSAGCPVPVKQGLADLDRSLVSPPERAAEISAVAQREGLAQEDDFSRRLIDCNEVTFFNSRPIPLDKPDWSLDYRTNLGWLAAWHSRIDFMDLDRPSDVKVPWELSRLQFLAGLGRRYLQTGDEELVRRAMRIVVDFDDRNVVGCGVAWACPMDCAFRAISLIWMRTFFATSASMDDAFWARVLRMLAEHGRFIYRNLEWSDIRGNHYSSDLLGLLYIAVALPGYAESRRWKTYAMRELEREIVHETFPDGVTHEGSLPYHRLVLEIFLHAFLVARRNGLAFSEAWQERLRRMLDVVDAYLKPDGCVPLIGDNDDGRVLRLGGQGLHDHRYLLAAGSALFGRSDWKRRAGLFWEEALWLTGVEGWEAWRRLPAAQPAQGGRAFAEAGFWFLHAGASYAAIDCGDIGMRGRGGHGHNDALTAVLCLGGRDVIVDRGTYSYTADRQLRLAALTAQAHNAPIVDGLEPSTFNFWDIPCVSAYPCRVLEWQAAEGGGRFRGRQEGYLPRLGVTVERDLRVDANGTVYIRDRLDGTGEHEAMWRWILASDLQVVHLDEQASEAELRAPDGQEFLVCWTPGLHALVEQDQVFPSYGLAVPTLALVFRTRGGFPLEASFTFSSPGAAQAGLEGDNIA